MPRQKSTHVDSPAAVGERLKAARVRAGLSQRQLAFPGCSPAYISRIESGDRIPSLQILRELGRRLGVTDDYLATGAEMPSDGGDVTDAELALRLGDLEGAEKLFDAALQQASSPVARGSALAGLGQVAFRRGEPAEAIRRFEEALEAWGRPESDYPELADSLGRAYAMVGELESAIGVFERCLESAEGRGDAIETIQFAVLLAYALIDGGNFGRAEELLGRALSLGRGFDNPSVQAHLYWSQSRLHAERDEPEIAARYARRALEILRATEDTYRIARAHQLLAHIEVDRGEPEEALRVLQAGWPLLEHTGNPLERAQYRLEEARALAKLGEREDAAALAMQISGVISSAHPEDAARSYSVLAGVYEDLGDGSRARELYELAAEMLRSQNPSRYLIHIFARLADLAESEGRKDEAFEYLKKAVGMQKAVAERHPSPPTNRL
jgi:tetratricopeptide (TPR) repeat protein/DNA-binding XRE family transcriptional regulator